MTDVDWIRDETSLRAAFLCGHGDLPRIAGFEIDCVIGRGAQGMVYAAREAAAGAPCALKVIPGHTPPAARRRLERELEISRTLDHPGIVAVRRAVETDDGGLALVMDLVDGERLDEWAWGPVPPDASRIARRALGERLRVFAETCEAVAHAHRHGVIHRDLKPGNVRVDSSGRARVLDFGAAALRGAGALDPAATALTATGAMLGTLAWASPEQVEGRAATADIRTDVYGLGAILHFLVTGHAPHADAASLRELVEAVTQGVPPSPRRRWPDCPEDIDTMTIRCLQRDPEARYPDAAAVGRDARRIIAGQQIEARRDTARAALERALHKARRHRRAASIVVAIALVVAAGATLLARRAVLAERQAAMQLRLAEEQRTRAEDAAQALFGIIVGLDPIASGDDADAAVETLVIRARAALDGPLAPHPEIAASVAFALGRALYNRKRPAEALELLRRAVTASAAYHEEEDGDRRRLRSETHAVLGLALAATGAVEEGLHELEAARSILDVEDPVDRRNIERIERRIEQLRSQAG